MRCAEIVRVLHVLRGNRKNIAHVTLSSNEDSTDCTILVRCFRVTRTSKPCSACSTNILHGHHASYVYKNTGYAHLIKSSLGLTNFAVCIRTLMVSVHLQCQDPVILKLTLDVLMAELDSYSTKSMPNALNRCYLIHMSE